MRKLVLLCLVSFTVALPPRNGLVSHGRRGLPFSKSSNADDGRPLEQMLRELISELDEVDVSARQRDDSCQILTDDAGSITRENYNRNVDECFLVQVNTILKVEFTNIDIEYAEDCGFDFVTIRSSYESEATPGMWVGTYCGLEIPQPQLVNGPLHIRFRSDHVNYGGSWSLRWRPATLSEGCPRIYLDTRGWRGSLNYPYNYPNNADDCIEIPGNLIEVRFIAFNLENSAGCSKDYVIVTDGSGNESRYCGSTIPPSDLYPGPVQIRFHSDGEGQGIGYLYYFDVED